MVLKFGNAGISDAVKVRHRTIHQIQNRPRRAEGDIEPDLAPRRPQHVGARCQLDAIVSHHRRVRSLEGVDRLLEVTDHEQGARPGFIVRGIRSGLEELVAQPPQQLPLRRAGVLRLVEKHMANAVIELPAHPLRRVAVGKHVIRQPDQIVVIQQPALRLQRAVAALIGTAEFVQRIRQLEAAMCRLRRQHAGQHFLRGLLHNDDIRERGADGGIGQPAFGHRRQLLGEQGIDKPVDMLAPSLLILAKPGRHLRRALHMLGNAACRKCRRSGADALDIQIADDPGRHRRRIGRRVDAPVIDEMLAQPLHHVGRGKPLLLLQQLVQNGFGIAFGRLRRDQADHRRQRRIGRPEQRLARLCFQTGLFEFVGKLGLRHDPGLDRKAAQHRLAEGMHRFHARPVIIVQNLGKQAARAGQHGLRRRADPHSGKICQQRLCGRHGPFCQHRRDPVAHFRSRRAGVGDAQDAVGRRAVQHQPQHPVRQQLGLSGSGIGRDEHR